MWEHLFQPHIFTFVASYVPSHLYVANLASKKTKLGIHTALHLLLTHTMLCYISSSSSSTHTLTAAPSSVQVHHDVSAATASSTEPKCTNTLTVSHSLAYDLETCTHPETHELFDLLTSPHFDVIHHSHTYTHQEIKQCCSYHQIQ